MMRILLVSDYRVFLDQGRAGLRRDGYDLIEATDALAGLHRAVEDGPRCAVVDLDLAGIDGLAFARQIARDEATRGLPVVVWGDAPGDRLGGLARAAGAFAYVDRARTPGALAGVVRRALTETAQRDPVARAAQIDPATTRPAPSSERPPGQSPNTSTPKIAAKTTWTYESDVAWDAGSATRP